MITINYLDKNGKAVKKFVARGQGDCTDSIVSVIKDNLTKFGGEILYKRNVSSESVFMIATFEDKLMQMAWEGFVSPLLQKTKIADVVCSKVLRIAEDKGDDVKAMEKVEKVKASLLEYGAAVLKEDKLADALYELVIFFTDVDKMQEWEIYTFGGSQE